jgi:UDP-N-acetyl-D-mannosaminuronic acid dehydrogenase
MAREVNDYKPEWVVEKVKAAMAGVLAVRSDARMADVKVACLGLAFKPDIDDLRESPAALIARKLSNFGCQILAVEPNVDALPGKLAADNVSLVSLDFALDNADVVCVLVKHQPFIAAAEKIAKHPVKIDVVGMIF